MTTTNETKCGLCDGSGYRRIRWTDGLNMKPCCDCNPDGKMPRESLDQALAALALMESPEPRNNEGKERAQGWLTLAERLSRLEQPFRSKNIAICLASAFRKGKMESLMESAKQAQDGMSPEEREDSKEQAVLSFAYGNVAMSNPSITTDDIRKAAAELKARAPMRTIFHDDGQIVTVRDRVED